MLILKTITLSFLTGFVCSSSLIQSSDASVTNHDLEPRKEFGHNLICDEELPVADGWPLVGPPRSQFQNLLELCARGGPPTVRFPLNVGCLCDYPYTGVRCPGIRSHPALWHRYNMYCQLKCRCNVKSTDLNRGPDSRVNLNLPRPGTNAIMPPLSHRIVASSGIQKRGRSVDSKLELHNRDGADSTGTTLEASCGGTCSTVAQ